MPENAVDFVQFIVEVSVKCPLEDSTRIKMCLRKYKIFSSCEPCSSTPYQNCQSPINNPTDETCNINIKSRRRIADDACATFFGTYLEYNYNFAWICEIHDYCYAWTNEKNKCDADFRHNMVEQCGTAGYPFSCDSMEEIAYFAVKLAGVIKKFHKSKRKQCLKRRGVYESILSDKILILNQLKTGNGTRWIPGWVEQPTNGTQLPNQEAVNRELKSKAVFKYEQMVENLSNLVSSKFV